jgi:hypothetical protein
MDRHTNENICISKKKVRKTNVLNSEKVAVNKNDIYKENERSEEKINQKKRKAHLLAMIY